MSRQKLSFCPPTARGDLQRGHGGNRRVGSDELARGARDAERVRDDVLNELVSREAAERDYGVVLTADGAVDVEATTGALSRILPRA